MADKWLQCLALIDSELHGISEFVNNHEAFTAQDVTELNADLAGLKKTIEILVKLASEKQSFSSKILQKQFFRLLSKTDSISVLKKEAFMRTQWEIINDIEDMRALLKTMR